jgi:hypothetical protein
VGFAPERNNRYNYALTAPLVPDNRSTATATTDPAATGIQADVFKGYVADTSGTTSGVPDGTATLVGTPATKFVGTAVGNIDADATLDRWSLSTDSRAMTAGDNAGNNVASGEPSNDINDVNK